MPSLQCQLSKLCPLCPKCVTTKAWSREKILSFTSDRYRPYKFPPKNSHDELNFHKDEPLSKDSFSASPHLCLVPNIVRIYVHNTNQVLKSVQSIMAGPVIQSVDFILFFDNRMSGQACAHLDKFWSPEFNNRAN